MSTMNRCKWDRELTHDLVGWEHDQDITLLHTIQQ